MIQRSNLVLLVVISGFIATQVESLRFDLQSGETKCIAEDIKSHAMTVGKYHIVNHHEGYPLPDTHRITVRSCIAKDIKSHAMTVGKYHIVNSNEGYLLPDAHKITVRVTSTFGNTYHQSDNVIEGHFAFETAEAGDYMTCFFAADHKPPLTLNIDFDWKTGVAAKDWTNVAKKGSVEVMEFELKRMLENVQAIHDEMFFLREREAEMQELNRSTNSKMAWMTGLSILLCLSVAGLQVWHLKTFFEKKKLI